jgi:DNA-binding transcriptional MerR regulator
MDKAVGAYRTISEVGEELDIPQHVLRFWETRFPQIKPMKRSGGRRYYRPADVLLLKGIRRLLYGEGYTIKGVQRILATQGAGVVQRAGEPSGEELAALGESDFSGDPANAGKSEQVPVAEVLEDHPVTGAEAPSEALSAPASAREPRLGDRGVFTGDLFPDHEVEVTSSPRRQRSILSSDHRRLLQSALDDLGECARLLDSFKEDDGRQRRAADKA